MYIIYSNIIYSLQGKSKNTTENTNGVKKLADLKTQFKKSYKKAIRYSIRKFFHYRRETNNSSNASGCIACKNSVAQQDLT